MLGKLQVILTGAAVAFLAGCAETPAAKVETEPAATAAAVVPTATEDALVSALNAERQKAGKAALKISPALSGLSREDSAAAAAAGQLPPNDAAKIRMRSGFGTVTKFQGTLKDRGAATGKGFVDYWMKGTPGEITDDWSQMGVGIAKSADGRLFAVVVLGRAGGGGGLMNPAMGPGGL